MGFWLQTPGPRKAAMTVRALCPVPAPAPPAFPRGHSCPLQFSQRHGQAGPQGARKGHSRDRKKNGLSALETDPYPNQAWELDWNQLKISFPALHRPKAGVSEALRL